MSKPLGLFFVGAFEIRLGESAGDKEFSEKVVAGESSPFWAFDEFQPKKEVKPPAGDFGLLGFPF